MRNWIVFSTLALYALPAVAFPPAPTDADRQAASYAAISTSFVENQGQTHTDVAYYARTFAGTAFVTRDGALVLSLPDRTGDRRVAIRQTLGRSDDPVVARQPKGRVVNYLMGDLDTHRTNVPTFDAVALGERYAGVDVELVAAGANVEQRYYVQAGADPAAITVRVEGADDLRLADDGRLEFVTPLGVVALSRPIAFQTIDGARHDVPVRYRVAASNYGFEVGGYDPRHELTIDPLLSSYLGGAEIDEGYAIDAAADGSGELHLFVAGNTRSSIDFPALTGVQTVFGGGESDAFVAKLDTRFRTLATTYLGGGRDDEARDVLVHEPADAGVPKVFVVGFTESADFVPRGEEDRGENQIDTYVVRLSDDLATLEATAWLGGTGSTDKTRAYAVDVLPRTAPDPDVLYVAGRTRSTLLTGSGAFGNGADDAFVAIVSTEPDGDDLLEVERSVYMGGSFNDQAFDIVVNDDAVFIAGLTSSGEPGQSGLPGIETGVSAIDRNDGNEDGFVTRLTSTDLSLVRSTYIGGVERDFVQAIALHPNGDLYAAGGAFSSDLDFPAGSNGAHEDWLGRQDAFVARFNTALTSHVETTFLGGTDTDVVYDLHVHPDSQELMVYGRTLSTDLRDTAGGLQDVGGRDTFLARLNAALSSVGQATYFGGTLFEEILGPGLDMAVDPDTGDQTAFITGITGSDDLPGVVTGAAQETRGGSNDAFVAKLDPSLQPSGPVFAAVLPGSRAVATTSTATAFATLINAGPTTLTGCGIAPDTLVLADFLYQTTDPMTNELTGTPDTPATIRVGASQSFLLALSPTEAFEPVEVSFAFVCDDSAVVPIVGVNTLLISASATPGPDVIALAASALPGQIVLDSVNAAGAFAVATANVGVTGDVTVQARSDAPVTLTICQTDPVSGACVNPAVAGTDPVALTVAGNATPTFAIFAFGDGGIIDFDPATNRVFVEVRDPTGAVIGSTSVAVSKPQ